MAILLSKWLGSLTDPALLLGILVVAAALAVLFDRRRLAKVLSAGAAVLVLGLGVLPVPAWLAQPLEDRFAPNPSLPDRVDGIILLGGTERVELSAARKQATLSDSTPVATWIALGRHFPDAQLVFSGGEHARDDPSVGEASIMQDFVNQLGGNHGAILVEDRSRNTHENATFSYALVRPEPGQRWVLVTEAIAMPRAVGAFRKAGWTVIPYPAGYTTTGRRASPLSLDLLAGLNVAATALHEWGGLLFYWLMDYTDDLFPR